MLFNARTIIEAATATISASDPSSTSPTIPLPIPPTDVKRCRLLGPTALVVQGLMGIFVILSLVWKRNHESPRRPWRIWIFDISKQIVGQIFVHFSNVFISDLVAHHSSNNPCTLYFLNVLVDTTVGVGLIYAFLLTGTWLLATKLQFKGFRSGDYGGVPPSKIFWLRQATVYVTSLLLMKVAVVLLFAVWPGLFAFGDWLLSWTDGDASLQVVFVMGLFPIVINVMQFWLIDSIVKLKDMSPTLPISSISNTEEQDRFIDSTHSESDDGNTTPGGKRAQSPPPSPSPLPTPPGTGYGPNQGKDSKGKAKRRGDLPDVANWPWDHEENKASGSRSPTGQTSPRPRLSTATSETWFMTSGVKRAHTSETDA
ncbi:vacuolar membrane protein [Rhizoctonia solani AG-3 Rhs1AP]|uniref:Vacuolar membrane protein n=2 Tax=Rhizoctonia solani AG-3 TaxID=1086053 RepID=A0A074T0X3_9AGAM|nr:vacuolar membrane protein [Rhizoctonia solani AG-3 Rhs1AP]KEP55672.1 vacuolar membrane protein [Rhizoctonia solani 123E]